MNISCVEQKWEDCSDVVKALACDNPYITPYCYYDFLSLLKGHPNIHKRKEYKQCAFRCFVVSKDGVSCFVAPLLINHAEKKLFLLGQFSSVGHSDFIYDKNLTVSEWWECVNALRALFAGYTLCLNQISEFSLTAKAMEETSIPHLAKDVCVKIDISEYEAWYAGLSKSCRQNLRTSYNRLRTDGIADEFFLYVNEVPSAKHRKDNIRLFSKRILEHTRLPKLLLLPMRVFKTYEPMTRALFSAPDSLFASVYLDGKLAATCNGVIANDGRAIITRLSFESNLKKYSPGGLLINELIKAVCEKYPFIRSIDLSRGDEPYKYTYGGVEHYNYSYEIVL